jgi:hypothetical protein
MPTISQFLGIAISMHYNDHMPPHLHAKFGDEQAAIALGSWRVLRGSLPRRALGIVREWATAHEGELTENWALARAGSPLKLVAPLE